MRRANRRAGTRDGAPCGRARGSGWYERSYYFQAWSTWGTSGGDAGGAGSGADAVEQGLERAAGQGDGRGVFDEAVEEVAAEHDAVRVERELLWIGRGGEVALGARDAGGGRDRVDPVLGRADQRVARRAGAIVELGAGGDEEAAAGAVTPGEPALEQLADAGLAARLAQRRDHHRLDELARRLLDDRDLERLLRAEVGEQPALRQPGVLGEPADGQPGEPADAGEVERLGQDGLSRLVALGRHDHQNSTVVLFVKRGTLRPAHAPGT